MNDRMIAGDGAGRRNIPSYDRDGPVFLPCPQSSSLRNPDAVPRESIRGSSAERRDAQGEEHVYRLPKVANCKALRIMCSLASVIYQGLTFAIFIVSVTFIIVNLPEAFTGIHYYLNIFLISILLYFFLYALALLLSWTGNLIHHVSQREPTPAPTQPSSCACQATQNAETAFQNFCRNQIEVQQRILNQIADIQRRSDALGREAVAGHVPRPARQHPEGQRCEPFGSEEVRRPVRSLQTSLAWFPFTDIQRRGQVMPTSWSPLEQLWSRRGQPDPCPADKPCQCEREGRLCSDCLRNADCDCISGAAQDDRLRQLEWDQGIQEARIVQGTLIRNRLERQARRDT